MCENAKLAKLKPAVADNDTALPIWKVSHPVSLMLLLELCL